MAPDPSLLTAVRSALTTARTLGYNSRSAAHDVYEAYLLTLFLRAAKNDGWHYELRDTSNAITTHAVFRMGPGRLPVPNYTHAYLTKIGKEPLEAHIGVKVLGASGVAHEFDLLVLTSNSADRCRKAYADPNASDVVAHAEAKYYGADIPLHLGRGMVGLAFDCRLFDKSVLATNRNSRSVEILLLNYHIMFRFLILPSNSMGEWFMERAFAEMLLAAP